MAAVGKAVRMHSLPFSYSAVMTPPILSASSLAMDNPSPVAFRAFSTVKKRSNSRSTCTRLSVGARFENVTAPFGSRLTARSHGCS